MFEQSYLNKSFTVADPNARIRQAANLMAFDMMGGSFRTIPKGTLVGIDDVRIVPSGANKASLFGRAVSANGLLLGWTSTTNLEGKFVNETLNRLKPALGSGQFGPHAAWSESKYLGQIDLIEIVDARLEIERLSADTVKPYLDMVNLAKSDEIVVAINSGFRSYPEQKYLYDGYKRKIPGFNKAAPPGTSKHQNGIAFDINVAGGDGNDVYDWLKRHAPALGFVRTVNGEPWHWEFDPPRATAAMLRGSYKIPTVTD